MEQELPKGWVNVTIGDLYYFIGGGTPSKSNSNYWNGDINWASIKDISRVNEIISTKDYISKEGLENSSANLAYENDLIIGTRISPGKPVISKITTAINQDLKIVKPFLDITSKFTFYCFLNLDKEFLKRSGGTTVKGIRLEKLREIPIKLPPLPEQKRIVQKLDALLGKVKTAQERLDKIPDILKCFRQSVLAQAVSGKLTEEWRKLNKNVENSEILITNAKLKLEEKNIKKKEIVLEYTNLNNLPDGWSWTNVDSISEKVTDGEHIKPKIEESGIYFLSAKDVRENGVNFSKSLFVSVEDAEKFRRRCNPQKGDTLIVSRGATVGRTCIVDTDKIFCLLGSVILIKPLDLFCKEYINFVFKAPSIKEKLISISGASAQQAIYLRDVKKVTIPIAPALEQKEIVRQVQSLFALADRIEARYQTFNAKVKTLPQAILAKAFRGELVPQDPTEESAAVLLERIKMERMAKEEANKAGKKRTKKKK